MLKGVLEGTLIVRTGGDRLRLGAHPTLAYGILPASYRFTHTDGDATLLDWSKLLHNLAVLEDG
jgi:hypothetical protein